MNKGDFSENIVETDKGRSGRIARGRGYEGIPGKIVGTGRKSVSCAGRAAMQCGQKHLYHAAGVLRSGDTQHDKLNLI